jgi:hypothetical protein
MHGDRDDPGWDLDIIENGWSRFRVYYVLGGLTLDPEDVSRRTGLVADSEAPVGSFTPGGKVRTVAFWKVESGLPSSDPFADHVAALLARLRPAWPAFVELGREHEASVLVVVETNINPLMGFEAQDLTALAELRVAIEFDMYPCGPKMLPRGSTRSSRR